FMELRLLRGTPTALAGHELVAPAGKRTNDDRLDHAALGDRVGQLLERAFVELAAGLLGMRLDGGDGQAREPFAADGGVPALAFGLLGARRNERFFAADLAQQRAKPPPQPAFRRRARIGAVFGAHAATLSLGRRPISSRASAM